VISISNPSSEREEPARAPGLGLQTMRERVEELGGRMRLLKAAGETTVEISLPLPSMEG
jgi:signal transduction histidine kinase